MNGNLVINFSITNPNSTSSLTGLAFTDALPTGTTIAASESGSCGGGTITATTGSSTITLSGATLAASASCNFTVTVTGTVVGNFTNGPITVTSTTGPSGVSRSYPYTVGDAIWVLECQLLCGSRQCRRNRNQHCWQRDRHLHQRWRSFRQHRQRLGRSQRLH